MYLKLKMGNAQSSNCIKGLRSIVSLAENKIFEYKLFCSGIAKFDEVVGTADCLVAKRWPDYTS